MDRLCRTATAAATAAITILTAAVLFACHGQSDCPTLLVEADSAFVRGDYATADSLLTAYDRLQPEASEAASMYRKLLDVEKKYVENSMTVTDFSTSDSLCRYFRGYGSKDSYTKALMFSAYTHKLSGNYPTALSNYLNAEKEAIACSSSSTLVCWIYQDIGDLYFDQRMYDECITYYRSFYNIAELRKDTLRMAQAAVRMGLVYTIGNEADSIIHYYNKAIDFGKRQPQANNIVLKAIHNLCDIYIQTEQYEEAKKLLSYDRMHMDNLAYWHLGQSCMDSASYYFQQLLNTDQWSEKVEYLRELIQLEISQGHPAKAVEYYTQLAIANDSSNLYQQIEETQKIKAQYNFNTIKQERDEIANRHQVLKRTFAISGIILIALIAFAINIWKSHSRKKERELAHERILRQQREVQYKQSQAQIEENNAKISALMQQLDMARQQNDIEKAKRIEIETKALAVQNQTIEVSQINKEYATKEFEASELYLHLKMQESPDKCHLDESDWQQLEHFVDGMYNQFSMRILSLATLSQTEIRVCHLVKVGVPPTHIATYLFITKSAVAKIRSRLYQKLTGQKGSSRQFDEFIANF